MRTAGPSGPSPSQFLEAEVRLQVVLEKSLESGSPEAIHSLSTSSRSLLTRARGIADTEQGRAEEDSALMCRCETASRKDGCHAWPLEQGARDILKVLPRSGGRRGPRTSASWASGILPFLSETSDFREESSMARCCDLLPSPCQKVLLPGYWDFQGL